MLRETEIGKLPFDWDVLELGQICSLITDGSHYSPKEELSSFFMASVKDMRYNHFDFKNCKTISKHDFDSLVQGNCSPNQGDILVSKDGANCLDLMFVYDQQYKIVLLSSIAIIRLKDGFNPYFYAYYMRSPDAQFLMRNKFVSGSAIPRVVLKDFRSVAIPIVPIVEQTTIAEVLKSFDDKIDLLYRQNKTLEQLAETLFRQWFVESNNNGYLVSLGEYVQCINGVSYKSSELNPSQNALVTLKSFDRNGGFRIDGFKEFTGKYKPQQIVNEGDLIVAHTDITQEAEVIGNPVLVVSNPNYATMIISMDLVKVVPLFDWLSNEFLYSLMLTREFKYHCLGNSNGSTVLHLNKTAIPSYEFYLPPIDQILAFTATSKPIIDKKFKNLSQIRTLTQLRDTLLPKLMSGEVIVKDYPLNL